MSHLEQAALGQPTLTVGQINERLAPISLSSDGLASLGFPPAALAKNAKLYHESDFTPICSGLIIHIGAAVNKFATKEAAS